MKTGCLQAKLFLFEQVIVDFYQYCNCFRKIKRIKIMLVTYFFGTYGFIAAVTVTSTLSATLMLKTDGNLIL